MIIFDFAVNLSKIHCAMSQEIGIFADILQTNKDKSLYMKSFFKSLFSAMCIVTMCVTVFSACETKEKYDFVFKVPGQITSTFGAELVIPFVAKNITSISVASQPKGWTIVGVDMVNWTITVKAPTAFTSDDSSVEENGTLKLTGYTSIGTTVHATSYLSLLNQQIDLSQKYSNCYPIFQKDTRYIIDVTRKGESEERIKPDSVNVFWQSKRALVPYSSYDAENGKFTFFVGHDDVKNDDGEVVDTRMPQGNAVVAAYANGGEVVWSWHLWLTGSDIEASTIQTSAGEFMDRNLGAYHNGNGSTNADDLYHSIGVYYQWGRKDPMAGPKDYRFSKNEDIYVYNAYDTFLRWHYVDAEEDAKAGTEEYARNNPMTFVLGSKTNDYDWLYTSHNDALWSAEKKSLNDPCPRGWRVPAGNVFESFDIDEVEDMAALGDVENMYGWHLVDRVTGVKMFMPGSGRRSFENGVITNVNNYGDEVTPKPWVGYYWTAGTAGAKAVSMFFDLNTTRAVNNRYEAKKEMYRANGMQVRCVRDK